MKPQTEIRPAAATDLNAILALDRATGNAPHWPLSSYAAVLEAEKQSADAPQTCLLVACHDALLVGFAVGLVNPAPSHPDAACIAELESVAVASAARRTGLGGSLCSALFDWCRTQGATEVILEVRAASIGAIALYTRLGFMPTGRRPHYYRNPDDDALLMRLSLKAEPSSPPDPAGAVA